MCIPISGFLSISLSFMGSKNVLKRMDPSEAGDGRHHMFSFPPMCCRRFAVTSLVFYLRTESEKNA